MNKFTIDRIKKIKGYKTNKQVAELFGLSDSDFINRKNRNTLTPLIVEWALMEKVDLNWLFKEHTDNFKMDLEVITREEAERRKKATTASASNIDTSNQSTPFTSSVDTPCVDPWQDHIAKTRFILESKTGYANSLAANIESFYDAVVTAEKLIDHENRLAQLEKLSTFGREKEEDSDAALAAAN